jgi:hypothetical protein
MREALDAFEHGPQADDTAALVLQCDAVEDLGGTDDPAHLGAGLH